MAKKSSMKTKKNAASTPTKSTAPKKSDTTQNWTTWIVAIVVIVALFLLIRGCKPAEQKDVIVPEAPTEGPKDDVDALPPTKPGEIVTKDALQSGKGGREGFFGEVKYTDSNLAIDVSSETVKISNIGCSANADGIRMISAKLTNVNEKRSYMISSNGVQKGYDTYFLVRGIVITNPGCDKETLAPGESTMCKTIGSTNPSYANVAGTNRVSIQAPNDDGLSRTEAVLVNC